MPGGARKRDIVPILHSFAAMNPPGMKVLMWIRGDGGSIAHVVLKAVQ